MQTLFASTHSWIFLTMSCLFWHINYTQNIRKVQYPQYSFGIISNQNSKENSTPIKNRICFKILILKIILNYFINNLWLHRFIKYFSCIYTCTRNIIIFCCLNISMSKYICNFSNLYSIVKNLCSITSSKIIKSTFFNSDFIMNYLKRITH